MLEIKNLSSGYEGGPDVLHNANVSVADGEVVALVGLNGAGKSTLVRALYGLLPARTGSITFGGADLTSTSCDKRARSGLMLVPEGRELCLSMTVDENLALGSLAIPRRERTRRVAATHEKVMSLFPVLGERSKQVVGLMSGGQQQMLAIARALMADPRLIILDEPSLGLAPQLVAQIFASLAELNRAGLGILLVEQNAAIALSFSQHAYSLELGRVTPIMTEPEQDGMAQKRVLHTAMAANIGTFARSSVVLLPEYSGVELYGSSLRP